MMIVRISFLLFTLLWLTGAVTLAQEPNYIGAGGCASSNCHGATSPAPEGDSRIWGNEYSIWSVRDKHAQAYSVLGNERSKRMAEVLRLGDPKTAKQCLDCHAVGSTTRFVSDGVACEACHGPAEKWLGAHTAADSTHQDNVALGMLDTKNLEVRARRCLDCHVGEGNRTVGHELIAAGHPDLVFELDTFSAALPMHWRAAKPQAGDSLPALRTLAVGQAMTFAKSMKLLAHAGSSAWPDFAHLECFQCHHDLRRDSWRIQRGYAGRKAGALIPNASRFVVLQALAAQVAANQSAGLRESVAALEKLIASSPGNGSAIAEAATRAAREGESLAKRFAGHDFTNQDASKIIAALSGDIGRIAGLGVNAAEQATMTVDSIAAAKGTTGVQAPIQQLYDYLEHPSSYRPAEFAAKFRAVAGQLN
jgi:hypothetical protein